MDNQEGGKLTVSTGANKTLTRLFFVLVFIAITAAAYVLLPEQTKNNSLSLQSHAPSIAPEKNITTNTIISQTKNTADKNTPPAPINNNPTNSSTTSITATSTDQSAEINLLSITFKINEQTYSLNLPAHSTAYDAMQKLIKDKKITAQMKEFSGMGYFVEEINGIKNNNQTGEYWIYYINGQSAQIGISSYLLKPNDLITWKYEKSKF